jgi:hypothetical protein
MASPQVAMAACSAAVPWSTSRRNSGSKSGDVAWQTFSRIKMPVAVAAATALDGATRLVCGGRDSIDPEV